MIAFQMKVNFIDKPMNKNAFFKKKLYNINHVKIIISKIFLQGQTIEFDKMYKQILVTM